MAGSRKLVAGSQNMTQINVLILMGSDSDAPVMQAAADILGELGVPCDMTVASAHRSPERVMRLVREAPATVTSPLVPPYEYAGSYWYSSIRIGADAVIDNMTWYPACCGESTK